jgi:hypothetical protein
LTMFHVKLLINHDTCMALTKLEIYSEYKIIKRRSVSNY